MSDVDTDGLLDALVSTVAVATLPIGILAGTTLGEGVAGAVFVVGWLFFVPVLSILSDYVDTESADGTFGQSDGETEDDALDRLRERYATGEIDEAEFERRLERLLETEDLEVRGDADLDRLTGTDARTDEGERGREPERERE